MEVGRRKRTTRNGVVAGSVWESRMKSDEIKGGIKVFNGEEENSEESGDKSLRPKPSPIGVSGKRKTWKSENSDGLQRSPIQIARQRSEINKNLDVQCKELSVSTDGIKKNPVQSKKSRSEQLSVSVDGIERSPIHKMKTRSEESKELNVFVERTERNPNQVRKAKSESQKLIGESDDGFERNLVQLRKVKPEFNKALDESVDTKTKLVSNKSLDGPSKNLDGLGDGTGRNSFELKVTKPESNEAFVESVVAIEKSPVGIDETRSDETCKECGVCEEKVISISLSNMGEVKSAPKLVANDDDDDDDDDEDWDEALDEGIEIEIEKKSFDVKKISIPEQKPKQVVNEEKMLHKVQEKPLPISPIVKKQTTTLVNHSRTHPTPKKTKPIPMSHGFQRSPETQIGFQRISQTHNKLQSLVDLVMWRDVSKSAFVFGIGTFIIIASSYTKDINIRKCKGVIRGDDTNQDYVVGEEEAVWLVKMILPYLNEFLLKFRALFCGDPATTMKLAIMLFVLAKCGSSITIWKMAKLGFFGVFSVPKICSSYFTLITAYGKFWIGQLRDAWESCSHKKAAAFGIFVLVRNLSSVVARIWATFRCYQQSLVRADWVEDEAKCKTTCQVQIGGQRQRRGFQSRQGCDISPRNLCNGILFPLLPAISYTATVVCRRNLTGDHHNSWMSLVNDSPVHSSSSEDFAAFLDAELNSTSDISPDLEDEDEDDDDDEDDSKPNIERVKRRKVEMLESMKDPEGLTPHVEAEESLETSVKKDICTHPGFFRGMCLLCGQVMEDDTAVRFGYIHKDLKLGNDEIARLRNRDLKNLLGHKKLYLVLDLDNTLLNSIRLLDITPNEEYLKSQTDSIEEHVNECHVSRGSLFRLDSMHMMTKLRPFVRTFLKEASNLFEMYIYTMGERSYALEMAKLLDPEKIYFSSRVIAQDDCTQRYQKGLDVVLGQESAVLILDDTEAVSLSELKSDESDTDGALASILTALKQIHSTFFDSELGVNLLERDVRQVMKTMAEQLGAICLTEVDSLVTHVISTDTGTEKSRWAVQEKFLVNPRWIEAANYLWQKQREENFPVNQAKN
ncbi:unnamed protein product [Camellia sinensis]